MKLHQWKVQRWAEPVKGAWKRWGCHFLTGQHEACSERGGFALVEMAEEVLEHSDEFWEDPQNSQLLLPEWFLAVSRTLIHNSFTSGQTHWPNKSTAVLEGKSTDPLMSCPNGLLVPYWKKSCVFPIQACLFSVSKCCIIALVKSLFLTEVFLSMFWCASAQFIFFNCEMVKLFIWVCLK